MEGLLAALPLLPPFPPLPLGLPPKAVLPLLLALLLFTEPLRLVCADTVVLKALVLYELVYKEADELSVARAPALEFAVGFFWVACEFSFEVGPLFVPWVDVAVALCPPALPGPALVLVGFAQAWADTPKSRARAVDKSVLFIVRSSIKKIGADTMPARIKIRASTVPFGITL